MPLLTFCIIGLHIAEIRLFGIAIHGFNYFPAPGTIGGTEPQRLLDAVYLSTTTCRRSATAISRRAGCCICCPAARR